MIFLSIFIFHRKTFHQMPLRGFYSTLLIQKSNIFCAVFVFLLRSTCLETFFHYCIPKCKPWQMGKSIELSRKVDVLFPFLEDIFFPPCTNGKIVCAAQSYKGGTQMQEPLYHGMVQEIKIDFAPFF